MLIILHARADVDINGASTEDQIEQIGSAFKYGTNEPQSRQDTLIFLLLKSIIYQKDMSQFRPTGIESVEIQITISLSSAMATESILRKSLFWLGNANPRAVRCEDGSLRVYIKLEIFIQQLVGEGVTVTGI